MFEQPGSSKQIRQLDSKAWFLGGAMAAALAAFTPEAEAQTSTRTVRVTNSVEVMQRAVDAAGHGLTDSRQIENLTLPAGVGERLTTVELQETHADDRGNQLRRDYAATPASGASAIGLERQLLSGSEQGGLYVTLVHNEVGLDYQSPTGTTTIRKGTHYQRANVYSVTDQNFSQSRTVFGISQTTDATEIVEQYVAPRHAVASGFGTTAEAALASALVNLAEADQRERLALSNTTMELQMRGTFQIPVDRTEPVPVRAVIQATHGAEFFQHLHVVSTERQANGEFAVQIEADVQPVRELRHVDNDGTETVERTEMQADAAPLEIRRQRP